jgi:hypothetical protein
MQVIVHNFSLFLGFYVFRPIHLQGHYFEYYVEVLKSLHSSKIH